MALVPNKPVHSNKRYVKKLTLLDFYQLTCIGSKYNLNIDRNTSAAPYNYQEIHSGQ